ncbi:MAG TPA: BREX-1 system phosphatase PglZ type B [Anaerolineales bacterium]|nr:BREX-1 system phosphatase PglZ type B [Anaerolineales bacterium]
MTVLERLVQALRDAATHNPSDMVRPLVILWPDEEGLWREAIPPLRDVVPVLWVLGDYAPDQAMGPSIWLRYQLEKVEPTAKSVPVLYLPGVSRSAFRNAEQCPAAARHLFALQFRGQFWTQKNGKDWTPAAFLSTSDGGLGLDVAGDQETRRAIQECLPKLLALDEGTLQGHKLEANDFRAYTTPDPAQTLLRWMGNPTQVRATLETLGSGWSSFRAICRDTYHFDPEKDGALGAAEKLVAGKGAWQNVWNRYREAPRNYSGVRELLAKLNRQPSVLPDPSDEFYPTLNIAAEENLAQALKTLENAAPKDAAQAIAEQAEAHAIRADWVWAQLGESPLAQAVRPLRQLAGTAQSLPHLGSWPELATYYASTGWKVDAAVIEALTFARQGAAKKAVVTAIRAVYLDWLERLAKMAQSIAAEYPNTGPRTCRTFAVETGTIYFFVDGLRMDVARLLEAQLIEAGYGVSFGTDWSALPTVTATAKRAWQPLARHLGGPLLSEGFDPVEQETEKALSHARFKQLLATERITFIDPDTTELGVECAWTESAAFDSHGHEGGAELAQRVKDDLAKVQQRIKDLFDAGWSRVQVVTDHGWLMVPGGMPKAELPKHLTQSKWGRCATLEPGAQSKYQATSWFWDSAEHVILAPGIACFTANMEYAHGGLTVQEALIPSLSITVGGGAPKSIALKSLKWSGLRLRAELDGIAGCSVDIRRKAADPKSSLAKEPAPAKADTPQITLLVLDEEALGDPAHLVVLDANGEVVFKHTLTVGEN